MTDDRVTCCFCGEPLNFPMVNLFVTGGPRRGQYIDLLTREVLHECPQENP